MQETPEETPEQEAARIQREIRAASEAGDIATIMRLVASTSALKPADFIKKTVGSLLFIYYSYIDKFHVKPRDVDDLVDGMLYIESRNYIEKRKEADREDH